MYCKNKGPIRMGQKLTRLRGHIKGRLIHSSKLQLGRHTLIFQSRKSYISEKINSEDRGYGKTELPSTMWVGLANS